MKLVLQYISPQSLCGPGLTRSMTHGTFQRSCLVNQFVAPIAKVRALRYCHRYMTEHSELRKGRRRLYVSFKDNQCGQGAQCSLDFSVDMHHKSGFSCLSSEQREHPREGESPGGPCCGYFFIFFKKVDLQAVMKAGRWSSGCTFTSFYLRDLCPQADSIRKTVPVLAAGEIMEISS